MLKREQKEAAVSRAREDFPFCGSILAPRCIFKRIARRILSTPAHSEILNRFPVKMYFVFPPQSATEILKLTPQTQHVSELAGFVAFLQSQEIFRPTLIRLNLVNALNRFREQR